MLSKILVSVLLVLQTGFVAADNTARKSSGGINARGLLVRQSTCPAGSFMCDDNTGCCDIGTTCGYRASDNYPICKGASCNGGPICLSGLCCDLGFVCNESTKLCAKDTGSGSNPVSSPAVSSTKAASTKASSSAAASSSSSKASTTKPSSTTSTASPNDLESSSSADDSTADASESSTTRSSPTTRRTTPPTTSVLDFGSPTSVNNGLPTSIPLAAGAEGLSGSIGKVVVGAVAGVLAFVL